MFSSSPGSLLFSPISKCGKKFLLNANGNISLFCYKSPGYINLLAPHPSFYAYLPYQIVGHLQMGHAFSYPMIAYMPPVLWKHILLYLANLFILPDSVLRLVFQTIPVWVGNPSYLSLIITSYIYLYFGTYQTMFKHIYLSVLSIRCDFLEGRDLSHLSQGNTFSQGSWCVTQCILNAQ